MNGSKATRFQRRRRRAQAVTWTLTASALAVMALTPLGSWLHGRLSDLVAGAPPPVQSPLTFVLFVVSATLICGLAALPALRYHQFAVDPADGRAGEGLRGWAAGVLVAVPAALGAASIVWMSAWSAGPRWWIVAGLALSGVLALGVHAGPRIAARLGSARPVDRPELTARIAALAARAGVPVASIQQWDVDESAGTIAMVAGMGRARRIFVARDVLHEWSDDEVTVIVAHELAHHVHHDLARTLGLNALVLCAGTRAGDLLVGAAGPLLGLSGVGEPAALPIVAMAVGVVWVVATPLRHAQSRRQERLADLFALDATGHAEAFATAIRRAGERRMAEDRPASLVRWLYHRHPSMGERLALAASHRVDRASRPTSRSSR